MKNRFILFRITVILLTGIMLIACPKEAAEITITVSPNQTGFNVTESGKTIVFEASIKEGERIISQDVRWNCKIYLYDEDDFDFDFDHSKGILSVGQGIILTIEVRATCKFDERLYEEAMVYTYLD